MLRGGARVRARAGMVVAAAGVTVAALLGAAGPAAAEPAPGAPLLTGWMPYWSTDASLTSFRGNYDLFASVSPFWHGTAAGATPGSVAIVNHDIGATPSVVVAQLKATGRKVIPSITDGTGTGYMAGVLANPATRTAHVEQLLALVKSRGYDGIDLDYEGFAFSDGRDSWAATKPNWAAFVTELAARFHAEGLLVTAAVPYSAYWVYDHATLGRELDAVRIMTYDWSVSRPGPIAPITWVRQETTTMLGMVPAEKLIMGIPEYGRDWAARTASGDYDIVDAAGKPATLDACPPTASVATRTVNAKDTYTLANRAGAVTTRDLTYDELKVRYAQTYSQGSKTCTVRREAWLADPQSVDNRLRAVISAGAAGAALWTIGGENPAQWDTLRYYTVSRGPIYWSPLTTGPYPVYGGILARYTAIGRENSPIGLPTSAEKPAAVPGSRTNDFQRGVILWSAGTGAHDVYGAILGKYRSMGGEAGQMGLPTSGEQAGVRPGVRFNTFQRGRIYWSGATGAQEIYGAILWRYAVLGADGSVLNVPTSGELAARLPGARVSNFVGGRIFWSSGTGAQEVYGAIGMRYAQLNSELSVLGLPTSGELAGAKPGSRYNTFQRGRIYWSGATGAHEVYGAILLKYLSMGAEASALGLPTSGEQPGGADGWRVSNFEHGAIYWSPISGAWVVYR